MKTGFVVSNILITPGVIPVNKLGAWSKLAGASSTFANNLSKTDLEFLPNSQNNIHDKAAYVALGLHQGKGWLLANLGSHTELEKEFCRAGKGPLDGKMLNKNVMN